ncbi:MAG: GNAT family N-acetyltransferase [Vicingus serpentipes]|nr:GNAT family N-acetyltransferase [Vicingus serpentipes]
MQPNDLDVVLEWENNPLTWEVSGTKKPFTKEEVKFFVNQKQDIYLYQQLRLMVCLNNGEQAIGCVDLFDFNEVNQTAGVGILIAKENYRRKGFAKEALSLLAIYVKEEFYLKQLFCNIDPLNLVSIKLFEGCGYLFAGKQEVFFKEVNHYQLLL